tara:strand:- start:1114 stop:2247 length:1134 start_codon:yes stop_codon:yes gene_type:complete
MPFSTGTFSRVHDWTSDRDAGIKISASRTDAEFDGIATGLTTCILKDGTQTLTAMIPFTLGLSVPTDKKIQLRDSAIFINSSADGQLNMAADTSVTITTPSLIITDNTTDEPIVQIKNTHNGTTAGELRFVMDKGAAGADGDDLGTISFFGDDAGQNQTAFAKIVGEVSEADETDEAGKLSFFVAESDGTNTALTAGLVLEGEHATDGEVDVTIGAGAASTTTVAGDLNVAGGDIIFGSAGKGINLGVTSNTDSNTLDDYEEGTWTASLISGSGITFSDSEENYVKIGRVVYINIACSFSGTSSNRVEISGLPFASSDTSAFTIFHSGGSLPQGAAFLAQTHSGHNRLSGGKSATDMSYTDVNGTSMRITGCYLATA